MPNKQQSQLKLHAFFQTLIRGWLKKLKRWYDGRDRILRVSFFCCSLYDKLTGRNAEIIYEFENMEISVPAAVNDKSNAAPWKLNGILRIRTQDNVTKK